MPQWIAAAAWPEIDEIVGMPYFSESVVLAQQKCEQVGECRQDEVIMIELARRLGLPHAEEELHDIYDRQLAPIGMSYKELVAHGPVTIPMTYRKYEQKGFATPTGKIELYSTRLEELGYDPLPYYEEPAISPVSTPETAKRFPYILSTGTRIPVYFNSEHRQLPSLRRARQDPQVEIHPDTAARHGIARGDWVRISTPHGSIRQRAHLSEDILPAVIDCQFGWWFPEREGWEHGIWDSNSNVLTSQAGPFDPAMGSYQLRALLCSIEKA